MNYAIVGCGLIGKKRIAALPQGSRLIVACDVQLERAQEIARTAGGADSTTAHGNVVCRPEIQIVAICTPNRFLAEIAAQAIRAGKHVLVEKPAGRNSHELKELITLASAYNVRVRVGFNHRYHPALQKARHLVDSGELGPLMFIRARYGHGGRTGYDGEWRSNPELSGGGELIDQGVHLIDLSRWFLGDFSRADGHAVTYFWKMPVDDNAFLSLRTRNGQTAWLHVSCTEWKNLFSFEIYGRDAKIHIEGLGGSYGIERLSFFKMLPEMGPPDTTIWEYPRDDESWRSEMLEFEDDIRLRREPHPGLEDAKAALDIAAAIYKKSGDLRRRKGARKHTVAKNILP